jgi:hypothetical protein
VSDLARRALQAPVPGEAATSSLDAQLTALGLTPYRAPEVSPAHWLADFCCTQPRAGPVAH